MMAFDAELHLTRLLGDNPLAHDDGELSLNADDLVEEAYLVLGSLPAKEQSQPQN
jgi:hypothetical protein